MVDVRAVAASLVAGSVAIGLALVPPLASGGCTVRSVCLETHPLPDGGPDGEAPPPGFPLYAVGDDLYESNPVIGEWLNFQGQEYLTFLLPPLGGRTVAEILPYVSADPRWFENGANFTIASGNLAEVVEFDDFHITLKNETCAQYYLRLLIRLAPPASGGGTVDGGIDAGDASDASSLDAAGERPIEGGG